MISIMDFFRFSGGILAGVVILGAILFSFSLPLFSLAIPVLGGLALWFLVIPFPELRTLSFLIFWMVLTGAMYGLYVIGSIAPISSGLRVAAQNISVFWLVFQGCILVLTPAWLLIAFGRTKFPEGNIWLILGTCLILISLGIAARGTFFQDPWRITQVKVVSPTVPEELVGLRIAQVTDVHIIHREDVRVWHDQLAAIQAEKPDILLFTGDFVDNLHYLPKAMEELEDIRKSFPLGVWAVLGNHDYFRGEATFAEAFREAGIPILENEHKELSWQGTPFVLAGVRYPFLDDWQKTGAHTSSVEIANRDLDHALAGKPEGIYTILAAHHPMVFEHAFKSEVNLSMAGHTHAWQVGWNGRSLNPFQKFAWGRYGDENFWGYVSDGAGDWFPFRLGAPPEIVIYELQRPD